MAKLLGLAKDAKTTADKRHKAALANSARTMTNVRIGRRSNGSTGAAVAGRKLSNGAKLRGGAV